MSLLNAALCLDEISVGRAPDPECLKTGLAALIQLRDPDRSWSHPGSTLDPYLREMAHEFLVVAAEQGVVMESPAVQRAKVLSQALRFAAEKPPAMPDERLKLP
jgi:uncharacterized protein YfaS (alpha-2-macroglobulin family)